MLTHKGTVVLHTKRLILRQFAISDAERMYYNWANDPEVTRYLFWQTHKSVDETLAILERWQEQYTDNSIYNWCIEFQPDKDIIGSITLGDIDGNHHRAYVGYCIGKAWWGQGVVAEALRAVLDFSFGEVGFQRVAAYHHIANTASGRVMEKAGMQREGIMRQYLLDKDGNYADAALWSAVRSS